MNPIEKIKLEMPGLTKSELIIADYIIANPLEIVRHPLTKIATASKSSNTAIIRLCQKLGYQGYSEFKFALSRHALSAGSEGEVSDPSVNGTGLSVIVKQYIETLNRLSAETDINEIREVAKRMVSANRLAIMGYNRTGFSASQLSFRLSKLGIANHLITDNVIMNDYTEILGEGDVCVLFSITTLLYPDIAKRLKESGCDLILFTMTPGSKIKKYANTTICLPRISYSSDMNFLDDQAIYFIFIEVLLSEIAKQQ